MQTYPTWPNLAAMMFARAREDAGDTLAEAETAQAVRVKYDALRWYASKLGPKTYGDELQHTGDPANPVSFVIRAPPPVESTDEWLRIYAPKPINGEAEAEAEDVPPPAPSPPLSPLPLPDFFLGDRDASSPR